MCNHWVALRFATETLYTASGGPMPSYRASLQFPFDSSLPRDIVSVNPHYNASDPDALAGALLANLMAWGPTANKPVTIKVYDAAKPPPSYPLATRVQGGTVPTSGVPRELALCLSYFSTYNRPRYRGRLFLPVTWFTATPSLRPSPGVMTAAMGFATAVLTKTLPAQTNWIVYSKVAGAGYGVSDYWVDDEWDTQRSRGLRATTRQTAKL
jgi:hypothetical protein